MGRLPVVPPPHPREHALLPEIGRYAKGDAGEDLPAVALTSGFPLAATRV
jgi:hypothetical protein